MKTKETDQQLALLVKNGKHDAFQSLFHRHYPKVCQIIHRFIRDQDTVEDLAQNVFVRMWERREQLDIQSTFGGYLYRVAVNEALGYLRRHKKNREEELKEETQTGFVPDHTENLEAEELRGEIRSAIDLLPTRCRAIFMLSRFEEMSYKEIAAQLDISVKTVENQMVKALRILRERLQKHLHWGWLILIWWGI